MSYLDDALSSTQSSKLRTQTSVMNGTLAAENMDVDKVCDAGGILDNDDPVPSRARCGGEVTRGGQA